MKSLAWTMISQRIRHRVCGYLFLLLFLFLVFYTFMEKNREISSPEKIESPVYIRFAGEVRKPGVYTFQSKNDLTEFLKEDLSYHSLDISWLLNSKPEWNTGITLKVTKRESEYHYEKLEIPAYQKITLGIAIDINKESVQGLTAIPGIGKSLALTIEQERSKKNGFSDINELKSLPGIGEKKLLKITPYIRL